MIRTFTQGLKSSKILSQGRKPINNLTGQLQAKLLTKSYPLGYCFSQNFNLDDYDNFAYKIPTQKPLLTKKQQNLSQEGQNAAEFLSKLKQSNKKEAVEQENVLNIKKFKHMIHNNKIKPMDMTVDQFNQLVMKKYSHLSKAFKQLQIADDRVQDTDQYEDLATND